MPKHLAVLGTGAIGSSIGADLTIAGHDVLLIDQWPAHVEAMKAHGLCVTMPVEELHVPVKALHLCELAGVRPQLDIVFLAAKSYDSCWMAELIKPYLKSDGVVVCMQNSFNDEWVAPIVGYQRDIACVVELSAEVFEPGHVKRNTDYSHTNFVLGELNGRTTPRLEEVARLLGLVGKTTVSTNIWGAKWAKFVYNTMNSSLHAIAGSKPTQNPRYMALAIKLGRETMQVGAALGYEMELFGLTTKDFISSTDETLEKLLRKVTTDTGKEARSCILQDILKGRLTEVGGYFNGLVARKGREVNVPTPCNEAVVSVIKQMEAGKLKPALSNLEILERYMQ